jgi:PAS domain S-box-containing protein
MVTGRVRAYPFGIVSEGDDTERLRWVHHALRQVPAVVGITRGPEHVFVFTSHGMDGALRGAEVLGRPGREALPELAKQGFFDIVDEVFRTGEPFIGRAIAAVVPDGAGGSVTRYFDYVYQPVLGADGRVEGVLSHASDVTDAVVARRDAEASLARLARAVRESPDGIVTISEDGRLLAANPAMERLLGRAALPHLGRSIDELGLIAPAALPAALAEVRRRFAEPGASGLFETTLLGASGEEIPVELNGTVVRDLDGRPVLQVVARDVRRRREEEQRRAEVDRRLQQAQRLESAGRLAGGIAHDFNNVLQLVLAQAELALSSDELAESLRPEIEAIRDAAASAGSLVRQLLLIARRQPTQRERVDVAALVRALAPLFERLAGRRSRFELGIDVPGPGVAVVDADRSQLEQVLINLVVNARDAIVDSGEVRLRLELRTLRDGEVEPLAPGPYVHLALSDTGTGIPADVLEHVFEPFFTTKPEGSGTGLGLSTAHAIVTQAGGAIAVESAEGRGSTFHVYLPQAASDAPDRAPPREAHGAPAPPTGARALTAAGPGTAPGPAHRAGRP